MAQHLHDPATGTQRARPALRRQAREQTLNATLATAATAARRRQPRDLRDGLRIALVNRLPNARRRHLITVTNQRVRRLRARLRGHIQNRSHRVKAAKSSGKTNELASLV